MLVRVCWRLALSCCAVVGLIGGSTAAGDLTAGFAVVDVTPELKPERPIWLAGKDLGRAAAGVHDKLYSRAIVLGDGAKRVALVSVDSIGLPNTIVKQVREQLKDIDYVLVASTHSHESPDVIGIWGKDQGTSGVVPEYVTFLVGKIVESVRKAAAAAEPAKAFFGTAKDESLLGDFRLPEVYDGVLRTVKFTRVSDNQPLGILVQWNSHGIEPGKNALISRDFMGSTVDALEKRHKCPVVYMQGAVGGLMGTPKKLIAAAKAGKLPTDPFGFIDACGSAVADFADLALGSATPITLTPLAVFSRDIAIPLDNDGYRAALGAGILNRPVFAWSGNRNELGPAMPAAKIAGRAAMQTEVAYLKLGDLHVAAIPGELYPECVYGQYQEPVDPGADYLDAPLETPISKILPSDKWLMIGLANDEVGYIVPKRQWDVKPPFAYGRKSAQYGEKNSVGPDTAGELLGALRDRVNEAGR